MATLGRGVAASLDRWLNDPEDSSISSFSLGSRSIDDASIPRTSPNISYIPVAHSNADQESDSSTISPRSERADTVFSGKSNKSTTTITTQSTGPNGAAVPWHIHVQTLPSPPINPIDSGIILPCEFLYTGCEVSFHSDRVEEWIAHSVSHFINHPPPSKCICLFCEREFEDKDDPQNSWRERMIHNREHFLEGLRNTRPDFWVPEHMRTHRLISIEDFDEVNRYTERPQVDGLVPAGFEIPDMAHKREKDSEVFHDLQREDRERKRMSRNRKEDSLQRHRNINRAGDVSLEYPVNT